MNYVYNDINYNLSGKRRLKLVKTYESALSEFGAALGVRLDFGISTALTDLEICLLDLDILDIYKRFSDSLHLTNPLIISHRNNKVDAHRYL